MLGGEQYEGGKSQNMRNKAALVSLAGLSAEKDNHPPRHSRVATYYSTLQVR